MRETCARGLAAALMTGAIVTVVGMAALVKAPTETGAPMSAPPSALQRSVHLAPQPARRPRRIAAGLVTRRTIHVRTRPQAVSSRSLAVVRRHPARRRSTRQRQLAATTPAPTAQPEAAPTDAGATPEPQAAPPAAAAPTDQAAEQDQGPGNGHGRGHAYGHDKQDD
jgi:hypothetical protein